MAEFPALPHSDNYTAACLHWLSGHIEWAASILGGKCESPIELGLLKAFIALRLVDRRIRLDGLPTGPLATEWEATVYPQHKSGGYRIDFAVHVTAGQRSAWIAVECDGHDFHERTKEQAARDKARDRALTAAGFRVMRFTGSEIHTSPMNCALQVSSLATSIAEEWE